MFGAGAVSAVALQSFADDDWLWPADRTPGNVRKLSSHIEESCLVTAPGGASLFGAGCDGKPGNVTTLSEDVEALCWVVSPRGAGCDGAQPM